MRSAPGLHHLDASDGDHEVGHPGLLLGVQGEVAEDAVRRGPVAGVTLAEGQTEGRRERGRLGGPRHFSRRSAALLQGEQTHRENMGENVRSTTAGSWAQTPTRPLQLRRLHPLRLLRLTRGPGLSQGSDTGGLYWLWGPGGGARHAP